ncbi:NADP-dependent phosphogluconate dehydrogenase [Chelativorans sp. SCAU2101]|jgi:6-phosphogluconate dehydrogenase, decarboxylating|uniref:6-phosphogluconate dehydrogenase, decarboxylating n=1 Tax=Chelativorans petroleitrophicus TaxID=2975484 RepID=A0A9X2X9F1_9HYPH|nr:NADP-dependent phosphogluconate dehydrogenase [Chelativorans petroleitrophicus]MCT8990062.1 NADP-dependent phosphogluconate dehydrogenase [Chelativorans petroleitrophicus]
MIKADIGLIGLGVMGANLALNIAEKGFRVAVFNRTTERTRAFVQEAGPLSERIVPCETLEGLTAAIERPRPIILMVPAGAAVDEQIATLLPLLDRDDIIIDAGNANFRDTRRRMAELADSGPRFIGMGVSGGEEGARHGPSIMVGGPEESYRRIAPILDAIAARYEGEACQAWLGPDGAGHLVKTIHNGIEYADMQMIAEIYGILRDGHGLQAHEIAPIFTKWNEGRLNSYLIEITAAVLAATDGDTGKPMVDVILDRAGQKGTGRWSAIEAQSLGVPATAIEAAVAARSLSAMKAEREAAERRFGVPAPSAGPVTEQALSILEAALFAGKIVAYAQGFAVMAAASREFGWNLPLATVARIWRAGCIIRSQFLGEIAAAFEKDPEAENLLTTPAFASLIETSHPHLRRVVARSAEAGLPVPSLSAALAHFDTFRRARGTANLIQAQRDFFGAHGFERIDREGTGFHGNWAKG